MKNDFLEKCKRTLGNKIDNFIRNEKNYKGKKARIKFAEHVNSLLNIKNFDEQSNYKKVSRWISGEVFPDFITTIAISKVLGLSLDELFNEDILSFSKFRSLTENEIKILKLLISNINEDNVVSVYIPYSFNNEQIFIKKDLLTREEIVKFYKEKATKICLLDRLKEYNRLVDCGTIINKEKHFPRFCSIEFIDSNEINFTDLINRNEDGTPKAIFYTNSDEYYEKISTVWHEYGQDNFYNVLFFDECFFDYNDESAYSNLDKAYYYRIKYFAESVYMKKFTTLIDKGIIEPMKYDFSIESSDFESDNNSKIELPIKKISEGKELCSFRAYNNNYDLETVRFAFKVNLSKFEQIEILKHEI